MWQVWVYHFWNSFNKGRQVLRHEGSWPLLKGRYYYKYNITGLWTQVHSIYNHQNVGYTWWEKNSLTLYECAAERTYAISRILHGTARFSMTVHDLFQIFSHTRNLRIRNSGTSQANTFNSFCLSCSPEYFQCSLSLNLKQLTFFRR